MRGFMVICNGPSESFVFQRDVKKKAVRVTLGRVGEITAEEARALAMKRWLEMKDGRIPNEERREANVRGMTLAEAFELYKSGGHEWSSKTLEEYEGIYQRELSRWANRTMQEIGEDRDGANTLHRDIYERVLKSGKAETRHRQS